MPLSKFLALKFQLGQVLKHGKQYRGADKPLPRRGRKQVWKYVTEMRSISTKSRRELSSSLFFLQGKAPKEIHDILTETPAYFLPGRAKDLSAPLYFCLLTTFRKFLEKIYK